MSAGSKFLTFDHQKKYQVCIGLLVRCQQMLFFLSLTAMEMTPEDYRIKLFRIQ
jgi:hypothetical protein